MKDKLLFKNSYTSRKSNGYNKAYWTKFVQSILPLETENNLEKVQIDSFNEMSPVFNLWVKNSGRALVIYQYNPQEFIHKQISSSKYITAWISKNKVEDTWISYLTIVMLPTTKNVAKGKSLIKSWFLKTGETRRMIEEIYKAQKD